MELNRLGFEDSLNLQTVLDFSGFRSVLVELEKLKCVCGDFLMSWREVCGSAMIGGLL
jgi:hypothetical protein